MATSPCPIMTHSMTTPCPDPSHRLGLAHPLLGPHLLLDFTSHRHLKLKSVRNWTHRPTNLLPLQGSLLSKGTTVYQVMHTRNLRAALDSTLLPLCYLLFHFPNLLCVHLSLPPP